MGNEEVNDLIEKNTGLIRKQLYKFNMIDDPEAISLGYEALYKAIMTYNKDSKAKFSTYASVCIYNALGSYIRKLNTEAMTNTVLYETPIAENLRLVDTLVSPITTDKVIMELEGVRQIFACIAACMLEETNKLKLDIIQDWVDSNFKKTHTNIAKSIGCSQTYVTKVIKQFRSNLNNKLGELKNDE